MGRITVKISDKAEREFRQTVTEVHGKKRGSLKKAYNEALEEWVLKEKIRTSITCSV